MVKAFIFDLDGIITDTAVFHFRAWKELADELGIDFDWEFNEQLKGISRMDSLERLLHHGGMSDDYSVAEKRTLAVNKNKIYQKLLDGLKHEDILPGIKELLIEMKEMGYKLGIASSSRNAAKVLELLGIADEFDTVADAERISHSKPAPDIFLLAAQNLRVQPPECIAIEDAASGIEAIKRAGMFAIGVGDREILSDADYIVPSTVQLSVRDMIDAWNKKYT